MTRKECTSTAQPSIVQVKQIGAGVYDVQICENITPTTTPRKNRDTGEIETGAGYSFTLYAGIVEAAEREKFIAECIHVRHSIDDEIALIHKHATDADNAEYAKYQELRTAVKEAAAEYFSEEAV